MVVVIVVVYSVVGIVSRGVRWGEEGERGGGGEEGGGGGEGEEGATVEWP